MKTKKVKEVCSFRLTDDASRILRALSEYIGVTRASIVEMCLREKWRDMSAEIKKNS